jgi:nicotinamide-nucleotide amidase
MDRSANPLVGTTVADGLVGVRVTARGDSAEHARALVDGICGQIRERLDEWIVGEGETTLAEAVGRELDAAGHSLALAESCTGGLVGKMLTDVSGASGYFLGGIVAYDNRIKREMLGVEESALDEHGAVSGAVAEQMARGARGRFGSDWALSLTGIAGPAGGSEEKPVGLVWIGLAGPEGAKAFRHVFAGERDRVRNRAALTALDHLRRALRVRA